MPLKLSIVFYKILRPTSVTLPWSAANILVHKPDTCACSEGSICNAASSTFAHKTNKLHLVPWSFKKLLLLFDLVVFKNTFESSGWYCISLVKFFNVFNRLISKMILILWHCPLFIRKLLKRNSASFEKVFWLHFHFWTTLIASMIHVVFLANTP